MMVTKEELGSLGRKHDCTDSREEEVKHNAFVSVRYNTDVATMEDAYILGAEYEYYHKHFSEEDVKKYERIRCHYIKCNDTSVRFFEFLNKHWNECIENIKNDIEKHEINKLQH